MKSRYEVGDLPVGQITPKAVECFTAERKEQEICIALNLNRYRTNFCHVLLQWRLVLDEGHYSGHCTVEEDKAKQFVVSAN